MNKFIICQKNSTPSTKRKIAKKNCCMLNYKINVSTVLPGMMVWGFVNVPTARHVCTELFNQILRSTVQFQVMCQPKVHAGFNGLYIVSSVEEETDVGITLANNPNLASMCSSSCES